MLYPQNLCMPVPFKLRDPLLLLETVQALVEIAWKLSPDSVESLNPKP